MQNQSPYRRAANRGRRAPQSDAIVIALTAQVLVCIILLLAAVLAKKVDEPAYRGVKDRYDEMVAQPADGQSAFAGFADFGGGMQQVFASIEQWITGLLGRFEGAPELPPAPEDNDAPTSPETQPQQDPAPPAISFDYDYLGDQIVRVDRAAGGYVTAGFLPADTAGESAPGRGATRLPAPQGATYAPVELAGNLRPPLGGALTSPFAYREHPMSGNDDFHTGMDIASPEGSAIVAVLPGKVTEVGESEIYGNFITLRHADNFETFYAHCSEILAAEGMQVRQGERIAKVGKTGMATGPHLHFSVLVDGLYTDPYWVLRDNIRPVEP